MPFCKKCKKLTHHNKSGERLQLQLCHNCYIMYKYGLDNPDRYRPTSSQEGIAIAHQDYYGGYKE